MINRIVLTGRLVADPELRYTASGIAVASFRIAVDRTFKNQQGERETDFINVVAWRQRAEFAANYLTKGRLIAVDGRLQIRQYQAQDGTKRTVAEVVADNVEGLDRPREPVDPQAQAAAPSHDEASPPAEFDDTDPFASA